MRERINPTPQRVAAGKANREERSLLTEDGREQLREAARVNRPWEHSTGPWTSQGKTQARLNGKRCKKDVPSVRVARAELGRVRGVLRSIQD